MDDVELDEILAQKMERVESLVHRLENSKDVSVRNDAQELVATLMDFHSEAIARMLEIVASEGESGVRVIHEMGSDRVVGSTLLLHGLHPMGVETRVEAALESVRPMLQSHKGDVQLVAIDATTAQLRLEGTCNGCPSSTQTFKSLIEEAIGDWAPEIVDIEIEGLAK